MPEEVKGSKGVGGRNCFCVSLASRTFHADVPAMCHTLLTCGSLLRVKPVTPVSGGHSIDPGVVWVRRAWGGACCSLAPPAAPRPPNMA